MHSLRAARIIDRNIRNVVIQFQSLSTTATDYSANEIKVPMRKERGPTDILEALESTITRDPTAPDYKYIDDPFLIPSSLSKKRIYALAKESGKRAAKWILEEHADLLRSKLSEPLITAFLPPDKYETKDQVSEEILKTLINQGAISQVLHIYKLLDKDVSKETKLQILELLCFYNGQEEQKSEESPEESSFRVEVPIDKNIWSNNSEIEELFRELKSDETTAAGAYNAMICGTAKYLKVDTAWTLYNECVQQNLPIAPITYNHVISLVPVLKDNVEDRKLLLKNLLIAMVQSGVRPNLGTLNAALKSTSTFQNAHLAKEFALALIAEFRNINIEPSLASYYHLLIIFCRPSGPTSNILVEILDELEKKEALKIQDPMDTKFFVNAMEIASKHMFDLETANRLHKLLLTKHNYKLLGGRLNESIYYRHYLQLVLQSETIDGFMKIYNILVPHIYIPEPTLMRDILEMLGLNQEEKTKEYLPQFLSQIVMFDMLDRHQIMKLTFRLLMKLSPPENPQLKDLFVQTTLTFWNHYQEVSQKRLQRAMWPAQVFGNVAVVLLRNNEFEKMLEILDYLVKSEDSIVGNIHENELREIFEACTSRGHVPGALSAIEYACNYGILDPSSMATKLEQSIPLTESQQKSLENVVGKKVLTSKKIN